MQRSALQKQVVRAGLQALGVRLRQTLAQTGPVRALLCLSVIAALWCPMASRAGPPPWPEAPYSHFSEKASLESVIAEFARTFNLSLNLSPGIQGVVNGRFSSPNPTDFISKLGGVYGFLWYVSQGTLYISKASESITRNMQVPSTSLPALKKALTDLGILDSKFGWAELPGQNTVLVSGPPSYVGLVENTLRALPAATSARQAMVFRLKYASSEDRTIRYRDREFVTPGLASILRAMVNAPGGRYATDEPIDPLEAALTRAPTIGPDINTPNLADRESRLREGGGLREPLVREGGRRSMIEGPAERNDYMRRALPSIQSDPRLNALIIQDYSERLPIYKQLIERLDVPTALIEIEAMILDVNTERAKDLGINWGGRSGGVAAGFGNLAVIPPPGTLSVVLGSPAARLTPGSLLAETGNYLVSQIRLLESQGDATIQSTPSVTTVDNVGALLDLSETFYIRTTGERVATVTPVTAGTTLKVTPRVITEGNERLVQLVIDIEDGRIQDQKIDQLPTVRRSTVSTQTMVRPDDTLLIAGYSQDQVLLSNNKVPFAGDLPGFGLLFSNRSTSVQRRERLFMIKPRILSLVGFGANQTVQVIDAVPAPARIPPPVSIATQPGTTTVAFVIETGPMQPNSATVARASAAFALGWPIEKFTMIADGELRRFRVGPFADRNQAMEWARRLEATTQVRTAIREVDVDARLLIEDVLNKPPSAR